MKWDNLRRSDNVEDRRGQRNRIPTGRGYGRRGYGGGGLGSLLNLLLLTRGLPKWVVLLILAFLFFSGGNFLMGPTSNPSSSYPPASQQINQSKEASSEEKEFLAAVLGSTEDFWQEELQKAGIDYRPAKLVLYTDTVQTSGCGFGSAQAGPFYCSGDRSVYIDLSFYRDLQYKYKAPGDFAMAYVLAHEVGHHIQTLVGTMDQYQAAARRASSSQQKALSVRLELQADYYAGAWARYAEEQGLLDAGDLEEAMGAAEAVGDDTLQKETYGRVVPDSFTHGSAKQRQAWFKRGYQYADLQHGDTFNTILPEEK